MPTVKGKDSSTGQRYTPASEYDDATLAQKREYWRNKKREQRARRRPAPKQSLNKMATATSIPLQIKNGSNHSVNMAASLQIGNTTSAVTPKSQKDQWLQTTKLNKVTYSTTTKSEVKCVRPVVNSVLASQRKSSFIVPPLTNSSSSQPCDSMQIQSNPKTSLNASIPVLIQPKPTTNITVVSSPCGPKSTPQFGTKSALVTQKKPANASITPVTKETEEEKAAKRRENWRIKKREQRARLAARLGKTKNRAQNVEVWTQKQNSGNTASRHVQSQNLRESGSLLKPVRMLQTSPPIVVVNKPAEPMRRNPSFFHLSGVTRPRSQTPRPNFIKQRYLKVKSRSLSYLYGGRGLPEIDPGDTPEQVIAKRREYWRIKKREQRAKLSTEVKSKLKERECLKRRVKRYHKILEDMRRAKAQSIMHASETIGGFIKEDGTVTISIPRVTVNLQTPRQQKVPNTEIGSTQPQASNFRMTSHRTLHVKVNVPVKQPPRIPPIKPQMGTNNSQESHLTLTPASLNTNFGSNSGGCVMKMAVSCKAQSLSAAYLDPSLTEEERMAKRREYWRVKKREQRAARAIRLRQSVSQARASAVLLKRKAQKHIASKRLPLQTGSINGNNVAYANEMKQESEFMPAVDLNSDQAICPDIKPPVSPTPPPAQADPDPALSADSQATTLLAVASMKKLLEESLSSVAECQTEPGSKMEEEKMEQNMNPDVSQFDVCAPTEQIENYKEELLQINELNSELELKDMSQITLSSTPDNSPTSQTPSFFVVSPKIETSECSQRRTLRPKKAGHQHCCSPEPPKLHHPSIDVQSETHSQGLNDSSAVTTKYPLAMETGPNSLQKKREYWKVMKRQQRARLKARQRNSSNVAALRNVQSSGYSLNKSAVVKPALRPKPSMSSGAAVTSIPTLLVVSPTAANAGPQGTLRVKPPVPSRDNDYSTKNKIRNTNVNSLPTLKPPDNPLTSINIQPIEPACPNTTPTFKSIVHKSITIPCPPSQSWGHKLVSPSKSSSNLVPPKPIPGESDEDFQRRKREYWRIKKKEQRARKAVQEKVKDRKLCWTRTQPQTPPQTRPQAQPLQVVESREWVYSSEESEHIINNSADSDGASFPFPNYTVPIEDDLYPEYESPDVEDSSGSEDFWRHHYLMDYDPLNQLLVCMVCGELQYVHSLEGVRGHIEEAHPDTLNLDPTERQRILQAWDEQVFHRERFFTNQLQQHSTSMTEAHGN